MHKIDDIEIAKMLLDPKKKSILDVAKQPITVGKMAEELNEKQSRLYYHVKKLEEAGLLELTDTKQQGNLIEKYYKTVDFVGQKAFLLGEELLKHHHSDVMGEIMKLLEPGLNMLANELQRGNNETFEEQVNLTISFSKLTGEEWASSQDRLLRSIKERKPGEETIKDMPKPKLSEEELKKKSNYAYFLLSYRIDEEKD